MSQHDDGTGQVVQQSNLVQFPFKPRISDIDLIDDEAPATPTFDKLVADAEKLDALSSYNCLRLTNEPLTSAFPLASKS